MFVIDPHFVNFLVYENLATAATTRWNRARNASGGFRLGLGHNPPPFRCQPPLS